MRIGIINDTSRYDTLGVHWRWAINRDFGEEAMLVECMHRTGPRSFRFRNEPNCDLYLYISDGHEYDIPDDFRPLFSVLSDTHLSETREMLLRRAEKSDYVFFNQAEPCDSWSGDVGREWLPHAAFFFTPTEWERHCDVACIMNMTDIPLFADRNENAKFLIDRYGDRAAITGGVFFNDMATIYGQSKIVWNQPVNEDLNARMFEAAAAGACIVTGPAHGLESVFGDLPLIYTDRDELVAQIEALLADPADRARRSEGLRKIAENHSYTKRVARVIEKYHEVYG